MRNTIKYPIGVQSFETIRTDNFVYVDKTDIVWSLAQMHVCFLCRPRRFGKSLLVSTLEAYFQGRRELFEGLKIMEQEQEWSSYPVLRVDFANENFMEPGTLGQKIEDLLCSWEHMYGKSPFATTTGARFQHVIHSAHEKTGRKVVVLIDEYDKPLLDVMSDPSLEETNRQVLKAFYSTFKAADNDLKFVLLTGVTKFSQISVFSGFNQPKDISMDRRFDAICGITTEELHTLFKDGIAEMSQVYGCTEDEIRNMLKERYDGYHFSDNMTDIYNPFSIMNAFDSMKMDSYWFQSGTPTYLVKLLEGHNVNLQKCIDQEYEASYFMDYRADVADPLAMLYQSGYLTIKGYDREYGTYRLDFPNVEVRKGFAALVASDYLRPSEQIGSWCLRVDKTMRSGNVDLIRDMFTSFLASIPYEANKDQRALDFETHYQYTLYLIFRILSCYDTVIEKRSSGGRADMVVETGKYVYIFEFKLDGSADEALAQIEEKGYAQPYLTDTRKIFRIGVNISSATRTVSEWKYQVLGCLVGGTD